MEIRNIALLFILIACYKKAPTEKYFTKIEIHNNYSLPEWYRRGLLHQ